MYQNKYEDFHLFQKLISTLEHAHNASQKKLSTKMYCS